MNKHNTEKQTISLAYPYESELSLVKALSMSDREICGYYLKFPKSHCVFRVNGISVGIFDVNPYTICRNSGIKDRKGKYIYEYDLLKLKHGLLPDSYGYLVWEENYKAWKIRQFISYGGHIDVNKYTVEVVGNIILNDDDAQIIFKQDEQEQQREVCIDNSYCPSCFKK
jgi:hypothetical protein